MRYVLCWFGLHDWSYMFRQRQCKWCPAIEYRKDPR
jgi:hypothetical protein